MKLIELNLYWINSISVLNPNLILIARSHGLESFDITKNKFDEISTFNSQIVYDLISFENKLGIDSFDDEFGIVEDSDQVNRFTSFILSNKGLFKIELDQNLKVVSISMVMANDENLDKISVSENYFFVWGNNKNTIFQFNKNGKNKKFK